MAAQVVPHLTVLHAKFLNHCQFLPGCQFVVSYYDPQKIYAAHIGRSTKISESEKKKKTIMLKYPEIVTLILGEYTQSRVAKICS